MKQSEFKNIFRPEFEGFTIRMWLDYCDEHNNILFEHMSLEQYCNTYSDWLHEKYEETLL